MTSWVSSSAILEKRFDLLIHFQVDSSLSESLISLFVPLIELARISGDLRFVFGPEVNLEDDFMCLCHRVVTTDSCLVIQLN